MNDVTATLAKLRRPRLLIRAARFGLDSYNRARDLRRVVPAPGSAGPMRMFDTLIDEEARLEEIRKTGDASYSVARHVDVLIALLAEARLLAAPRAVS